MDAGKVELDGARYLNFNLPFSISQLVWIEAILVGGAEIYRNRELDPEARIYPGAALPASPSAALPRADAPCQPPLMRPRSSSLTWPCRASLEQPVRCFSHQKG